MGTRTSARLRGASTDDDDEWQQVPDEWLQETADDRPTRGTRSSPRKIKAPPKPKTPPPDEDDEEENEAGNTDTDKGKLKKVTKMALRRKAQDRTDMYRAFDGSALMAIGATRFLYSLVKIILKNLRYRYGTARTCVTDDEQRPARRLGGANVET